MAISLFYSCSPAAVLFLGSHEPVCDTTVVRTQLNAEPSPEFYGQTVVFVLDDAFAIEQGMDFVTYLGNSAGASLGTRSKNASVRKRHAQCRRSENLLPVMFHAPDKLTACFQGYGIVPGRGLDCKGRGFFS